MRISISFLLLSAAILFSTGCKKEEKGSLEIRFTGLYGNSSFQLFTDYPTPTGGDTIQFQTLNFLLSDIRLVDKDNKEVSLFSDDAAFINFAAPNSLSLSLEDVPTGEYKSIRFGIGVPAATNNKTPSQFPATSPLGDVGNYWTAWDSYIFSRVEGILDTSRSNSGTLPYLYHGGANDMYQERTIEREFSVVGENTTTLLFTLQARDIFYPSSGSVDIRAINVSHSAAVGTPQFDVALSVIRNLANAIQ